MRFLFGFVAGVVTFTGLNSGLRTDVARWANTIRETLLLAWQGVVG